MKDHPNIEQHALDLINGGIDASLSEAEQKDLASLLAGSSGAREISDELQSIVEHIESVPELEPPDYLQESIERQVRLPAQSASPAARKGVLGTWLSVNWLRTGFALAAGVVLTVGVYEMGSGPISEQDATKMVGTVVKNRDTTQGALLDRINISNDRLNGLVEVREKKGLFTLYVHLKSEGLAEIAINFAGQGLDFEGIGGKQDFNNKVNVQDGSVKVTGSGEQNYTMSLRRNPDAQEQKLAPLELAFYADNVLVHETELNVSKQ